MTQDAIATITLNPALDFATTVDVIEPNEKLRCSDPSMFPGGGGVNVARAIWNLGGVAQACVALGGPNGQALELLLRAEDVDVVPVKLDLRTRHSMTVRETSTGQLLRFMLPGTRWTRAIEEEFFESVRERIGRSQWCVLSGSMPPGTDFRLIERLTTLCLEQSCKLVVDTSGETLRALAQTAELDVDILRMNGAEAQESTNQTLIEPVDFANAARRMIERGAARMIVMGLSGGTNLIVCNDGVAFMAIGPDVEVISRTGAGDSFVAGMVLSLARGAGVDEALRQGTAAASAAVTVAGTQLCDMYTTERFARDIVVDQI